MPPKWKDRLIPKAIRKGFSSRPVSPNPQPLEAEAPSSQSLTPPGSVNTFSVDGLATSRPDHAGSLSDQSTALQLLSPSARFQPQPADEAAHVISPLSQPTSLLSSVSPNIYNPTGPVTLTSVVGNQNNINTSNTFVNSTSNSLISDKLGHVVGAEFKHEDRKGCMEGTCVQLLEDLITWAKDRAAPQVFWLSGMAGTGKTTVTETFCTTLHAENLLGASHFCSRKSSDRQNIRLIFPSLAKSLAFSNKAFHDALVNILSQCSDPLGINLDEQYETLIERPADMAIRKGGMLGIYVAAVDALDECEDKDATKKFLNVVLKHKHLELIKFFVTSRPEIHIREAFKDGLYSTLRLHEIEGHIVQADIELFVYAELQKIGDIWQEYGHQWPPQEAKAIVEHSGKLFIYASTICKFIGTGKGDACGRLAKVAQSLSHPIAIRSVDEVYEFILAEAFTDIDEEEVEVIKRTLSAVVCSRTPLSILGYSQLLDLKPRVFKNALASLHSVLYLPSTDETGEVALYHASFPDYLTTANRSQSKKWFICSRDGHHQLALDCLAIMCKELHFNISGAVTSHKSNKDQPKKLTISKHLGYACTSWGDHYFLSLSQGCNPGEDIASMVEKFLVDKFLYWLEALSVLGRVQYASGVLFQLFTEISHSSTLKEISNNFRRFIGTFLKPIQESAPHIYLSALPLSSSNSMISKLFAPLFPSTIYIANKIAAMQPQVLQIYGHTDAITFVAFSPDGKYIASGSDDKTICLWSAETGEAVQKPFEGHTDLVRSVAFSPDGKYIVSGSDDKTICLWSAETGEAVQKPFEGHTDAITSVAFSPDGKYIASGSDDKTICLWSAETGEAVQKPFEGHTYWVRSVAFSPDGKYIASGSNDKTICLWSAETGEAVQKPFEGHTDLVRSVAFSPDGKYIVSGSDDKTICLWSAETGEAVQKPFEGHTDAITSVAFSPDGKYIASGSDDKTICLWSAETGEAVQKPFEGHTDLVRSVAFSPDGKYIVSGSVDKTICLWNSKLGEPHQVKQISLLAIRYLHNYPPGSFTVQGDGWVIGPDDNLIFWISPHLHSSLCTPGSIKIIGRQDELKVDMSRFVHGENWINCRK